ncbi:MULTISPECIES: serine--tRNA ligase [unclassified Novosphingobium]|uniref:serine--tRNA ligase n=1 Tax=unclassified Novosphingobium TaxID=2644732 RepID=UPI000ED38233|nr:MULTISPECIES: serine--tRNA ligase [unclassified Novosphingobium]HCF24966.1 serine--tRNA ligase [Novosphingobium sp.]HQV03124.1 serine--tRNA ligase [Novosphingobium sp.]
MHDIKFIRENPEAFDAGLARRGLEPQAAAILALDAERRAVATRMQEAQSRRNDASKLIGAAMGRGDKDEAERLKGEVASLKDTLPALETEERELTQKLSDVLAIIPNMPHESVPQGADETDNVEVSRWGAPRSFAFSPKEHADLGPSLGLDFETGALISGARFTFLRGQMARLQRAIGQFMVDHQTGVNGYTECATPVLVRDEAMYGTDKLPKFAEDSFRTTDGRWLIPTSEVSLTSSVMGQIIDDAALPMRMTALTLCFRSEAGAAGKDTRGFIRQHQFEKCELVSVVRPQDSEAEHERMTGAAESILQALELPYRKVLLCTGDMGFGARKTYDLEVWLPGQDTYREISSCSNCGDFQARRMSARYRPEGGKGTEFVHTLNGSGLAVGRTLVAVLENYQQEDGSVEIPKALLPYMGGIDRLVPG